MKFLITSYSDPTDQRIVEGTGFVVDEAGHICIKDNGETIARLLNVNIEPLPAVGKVSSVKTAKLAGKYINFDLLDWMSGPQSPETVNAVSDDIQALAASVLSQTGTK